MEPKRNMLEEEEEENELVQSFLHTKDIPLDTQKGVTVVASHVRQSETWDCGIACLQMILGSGVSYNLIRNAIGNTQSIWTADLVWYLYRNPQQRRCWFVTKSLWPNPEWKQLAYYQPAYAQDCPRVTQRVWEMQQQQQQASNVSLLQRNSSLSLNVVKELVQRDDCVAMALVDHSILVLLLLMNHQQPSTGHYVGHYIVLTGIVQDDTTDHNDFFVVHNPATDEAPTYVSMETFERAWRAHGTDEDIVFVFTTDSERGRVSE